MKAPKKQHLQCCCKTCRVVPCGRTVLADARATARRQAAALHRFLKKQPLQCCCKTCRVAARRRTLFEQTVARRQAPALHRLLLGHPPFFPVGAKTRFGDEALKKQPLLLRVGRKTCFAVKALKIRNSTFLWLRAPASGRPTLDLLAGARSYTRTRFPLSSAKPGFACWAPVD